MVGKILGVLSLLMIWGTLISCDDGSSNDDSSLPEDPIVIEDTIADSDSAFINGESFVPTIKECALKGAGYTILLTDGTDSITFVTSSIVAGEYTVFDFENPTADSLFVQVTSTFGAGDNDARKGTLLLGTPNADSIFTGMYHFLTNISTYNGDTLSVDSVRGEFIAMKGVYAVDTGKVQYHLAGRGISSDPFLIQSRDDLYGFASDTFYYAQGIYVKLTTDIDLSPVLPGALQLSAALIAPQIQTQYMGYHGRAYGGNFDGNSQSITNLFIEDSSASVGNFGSDYQGLFGQISGGVVRNLVIDQAVVKGDDYLGILAGASSGATITNVQVQGTVTSVAFGDVEDPGNIGGLVGDAGVGNRVLWCSSNATVSGVRDAGGLIGHMLNDNSISQCYSRGKVTVSERYAGGLVGFRNGSVIDNSYSLVSVVGPYSGGFIGTGSGVIKNCYALGSVSAGNYGFIGGSYLGTENSFWSPMYSNVAVSSKIYNESTNSWSDVSASIEDVLVGIDSSSFATEKVFTDSHWDFIGESTNGSLEIWEMGGSSSYPFPVLVQMK